MSHTSDPDPIEVLVHGRLQRELKRAGGALAPSAALVRSVRAVLFRPELTDEESTALRNVRSDRAGDPLAAVLSSRLGAALSVGHALACREAGLADAGPPSAVFVLRKAGGARRGELDVQIASAMARLRPHLESPRAGRSGDSTLFLLAHEQAFERIRRFLPSAAGAPAGDAPARSRVVFYRRQESALGAAPVAASEVEVVEADRELATFETYLLRLLDAASADAVQPPDARDEPSGNELRERAELPNAAAAASSDAPLPVADPLIGTLFHHKYRILSMIGVGGFGSVYEARDERGAGNRVAIKILRSDLATNPVLVTAFRNEARRLTRLGHPNIVDWKVFDESDDGTRYFVMELVEGEELDRLLAREAPLPPKRAARILLQILDALRAAHHLGEGESILHLDLKPRNVFVVPARAGREEQVKVIDFGIGQYIGEEAEDELPDLSASTPRDAAAGDTGFHATTMRFKVADEVPAPKGFRRCSGCTPEYASPEQSAHVLGLDDIRTLDGRSDLYSLGVMAFQMLTGHLPFTRPLSRADMLRLHLHRPPRRLGSMGVKVPRALAHFVDRCLQKDPDDRFPDTHIALRAMQAIVHPPIGKRVALIGVPLLLVAFVVGGLIMRREAAPSVALVSETGEVSATQPLFLGRARTDALLRSAVSLGDVTSARLVRVADGEPLAGWTASIEDGAVRVRAPSAPLRGRVAERVRLDFEGADVRANDFTLVWLGEDAWRIERASVGGVDTSALGDRAIDPRGLELDVRLAGAARGDVAAVSVGVGERAPLSLPLRVHERDVDVYAIPLEHLALANGVHTIQIRVEDRAGGAHDQELAFDAVTTPLAPSKVELRDAAAGGAPETFPPCNRIGGGWLFSPRTHPVLWIELERPAKLSWSIEADGDSQAIGSGELPSARAHAVELGSSLARATTTNRFRGRLRYRLDESESVLHAAGSPRGAFSDAVAFELTSVQPELVVRLSGSDGVAERLAPSRDAYVRHAEVELAVERAARTPLHVLVRVRPEDGGDERVFESAELRNLSASEARFPVRFASEGSFAVRVEAYQYDSQAEARAERPDLEIPLRIVFDTHAPRAQLEGTGASPLLLTNEHPDLPALTLALGGEVRGSPIEARVQVARANESTALFTRTIAADLVDGDRRALPPLDLGVALEADGEYVLTLLCNDQAGNRSEPIALPFTRARAGPALRVEAPSKGGQWQPGSGNRWSVQVRADDANGVASVACEIERTRTSDGASAQRVAVPMADVGGSVWVGALTFPYDWSSTQVTLHVRASDRMGVASVLAQEGFELPTIHRPRPALVADARGARMRFVEGNAGFTYAFGGQGDDVENRKFRDGGLAPFNPDRGRGRELSWSVPYEPGAIGDYYLDEHEVSVGDFLQFVRAPDGFAAPESWPAGCASAADAARRTEVETRFAALDSEQPAHDVTWEEASAYARWVGKRLPSFVEWEYAARGGAQYRPFAACSVDGVAEPSLNVAQKGVVGAPWKRGRGDDVTPDTRIRDLAGNVAEWTSTPVAPEHGGKLPPNVARHAQEQRELYLGARPHADWERAGAFWFAGGSFADQRYDFSVADHRGRTWRNVKVGFRCAASLADVRRALESGAFEEVP
ncbi:MAG: protein kinase domain-containing protein [Planctomycetota bacterium]